MNLADVMQQLADRADTIPGLRCFAYPPNKITPPAFEVDLPERVNFDGTYGRGLDFIRLTANVLVSRANDRASVVEIVPYIAGSGPKSIKEVLESGEYTAMDVVHIPECEFAIFPVAGNTYLGAQFTIDITGSGA